MKTKKLIGFFILILTLTSILLSSCMHEHSFGAWITTREATCNEQGVEQRVCDCGEEETRSIPTKTTHNYSYGFCQNCKKATEERIENLDVVAKGIGELYWLGNYEISPNDLKMKVEYDSILPNLSTLTCNIVGSLFVEYDGETFKGNFDIDCKWKGEDFNDFIWENGGFDDFYACDNSGQIANYRFSSSSTFTCYKTGKAKSVITFDNQDNFTQKVYDYNGKLIGTYNATYDMIVTPISWVITVTSSSGNEETMYYYPKVKGVKWGTDIYVSF